MANYLRKRILQEEDPLMAAALYRLFLDLTREEAVYSEPIKPQSGQMVLPGFEGIMGYSVVA